MADGRRNAMSVTTWVMIGAGVGMAVGFGTCGLAVIGPWHENQDVAAIGAFVFFGSLGVAVLSVLVMIVLGLVRAVRK